MATPLHIAQCVRRNGMTYLVVTGHGLTVANEGQKITIAGVSDASVNVTATIFKVIVPDTIRFRQPGLPDIPNGLVGGAVAIG
jgi:hypothetical protein